uniref:Uncharacterized protein n=1 Tax=Chenopodium quinoa TaxID=63459 RepID=A0A803KXX2_CHEQI
MKLSPIRGYPVLSLLLNFIMLLIRTTTTPF